MIVTDTPLQERGMILINVLVIVILATSVLAIMLAGQDSQIDRSQQLSAATQAMAIARGSELTAITALRRDVASGSLTDTLNEPWANIADNNVHIAGGTFSFAVADAQSRFNINNLSRGDAISADMLKQVGAATGLPPDRVIAMLALLQTHGPINDISELRSLGLGEDQLRRLAAYCTALPTPTTVNVNTASEPLLAMLTGSPATAHAIVMMRARDSAALSANPLILPPGTSQTSDYFWTRGRVTIGGTTQQLTTLLHRRQDQGMTVVSPIRRWRGVAPLGAPPFPD